MFLLGSHNAPWFLIGRPVAAILVGTYLISKIKPKFLIVPVIIGICILNIAAVKNNLGSGQTLLEPDPGAILSRQIAVMEYTYQKANSEPFSIDTVTNPLYINAVWAWNYDWYSQNKSLKPTWLGGDQLSPYNTLDKATGKEKYLFLIIDETFRIPDLYTQKAIVSISEKGKLIEEKSFNGLRVMTFANQKAF
jgi:hypothetical protein